MIALIDADVVLYRVGFASQEQSETQNCMNAELVMEQILSDTGATEYKAYLSDKLENNYRFKIDPNYKANRKDAPKPKWYNSIKTFLQKQWKAEITPGQEADDALGIAQTNTPQGRFQVSHDTWEAHGSIICSIDKDLLQVPGNHYNLAKREKTTVNYVEGLRNFYGQFLIGDRIDNIDGIYGLGKVKTKGILGPCETEQEMFQRVRNIYDQRGRIRDLLKNGQLLWVRRQEGEIWQFPCELETTTGEGEDVETE